MSDRWRPTAALVTAIGFVGTLLVVAVFARRADLVVVAAPVAVACLFAVQLPRGPGGQIDVRLPNVSVWEGDLAEVEVTLQVPGAELVCVGVRHSRGVSVEAPGSLQVAAGDLTGRAQLQFPSRAVRWGRATVGPITAVATSALGLLQRGLPTTRSWTLTVVPLRAVFDATDTVPHASGLVGTHRSRLPGSGTDLLAIRAFQPGDRLKRITWPVSLRTGQLHVTTTTDDRDTDVLLVVDTGVDVGDPRSEGGTSLDVTVRGAAAVAEHYLRQGDRVGLLDLGAARRPVRIDAGRRHMLRVLDVLVDSTPHARRDEDRITRQLRAVPPRTLVMVFSTLLDERTAGHIGTLKRSGNTVLVVDTLPDSVVPVAEHEWTRVAWQVALLSRDNLRLRLRELGVPVVGWRGARSLDQVLFQLSRSAALPRRRT